MYFHLVSVSWEAVSHHRPPAHFRGPAFRVIGSDALDRTKAVGAGTCLERGVVRLIVSLRTQMVISLIAD
jgi:hypothetical protein